MEPLVLNSVVDWVMFFLVCVGIVSFAVSGTIIAIQKKTDLIGAIIFAFTTAFGGGLIRDIIIGRNPPALFSTVEYAIYAIICLAVSLSLFLVSFIGKAATVLTGQIHNRLLEGSDSLGLALFCVLGVDSAATFCAANGISANPGLLIFCGCITGIGGGILRDIFSAQIPLIFRKHVYLIPALLGTGCYVFLLPYLPRLAVILISVSIILILRILAMRFHWNWPTPLNVKKEK